MTSYHNNHAITQEISRIKRNDPESTIYGVWNSILSLQFPISQGYVTRPQDEHTLQSGEKGFSDLHTYQYPGISTTARKFLIVQCKRAGFETRESVWDEGTSQLDRYLAATHGTRARGNRSPVYGIIAVGKWMRVYRYDDINQRVLNWSPRGVKAGTAWDLQRNHDRIQRILDHILMNH